MSSIDYKTRGNKCTVNTLRGRLLNMIELKLLRYGSDIIDVSM